MNLIGFDIGGTNTTITAADDNLKIYDIYKFKTLKNYKDELKKSDNFIKNCIKNYDVKSIGISIGGPLNMEKGIIINPPHLPGYWNVNIKNVIENKYNIKVKLVHDALSSAIAEWKWGNGKNSKNMVFLTFGTGFGAGFILNGLPYYNKNNLELGYNRISIKSNMKYDYMCSGSGLNDMINKYGEKIAIKKSLDYLSYVLSFLSNTLGLDKAIIGGVFTYRYNEFYPYIIKKFKKLSLNNMEIMPSIFGKDIGIYSSIAAAMF